MWKDEGKKAVDIEDKLKAVLKEKGVTFDRLMTKGVRLHRPSRNRLICYVAPGDSLQTHHMLVVQLGFHTECEIKL